MPASAVCGHYRMWRAWRRLHPLWLTLTRVFPETRLPVRAGILLGAGYCLHRRVIEIRDAQLALRPYLDPLVAAQAAAAACAAGLGPQARDAVTEAALILAAISRPALPQPGARGSLPGGAAIPPPGNSLASETARLVLVADAMPPADTVVRPGFAEPAQRHPILPSAAAVRRCAMIADGLHIPRPFELGRFLAGIEARRNHPVVLRSLDPGPVKPSARWIAAPAADFILRTTGTTPWHRTHVTMHEVAHMLLEHDGPARSRRTLAAVAEQELPVHARPVPGRCGYTTAAERDAEFLASIILARAAGGTGKDGSEIMPPPALRLPEVSLAQVLTRVPPPRGSAWPRRRPPARSRRLPPCGPPDPARAVPGPRLS